VHRAVKTAEQFLMYMATHVYTDKMRSRFSCNNFVAPCVTSYVMMYHRVQKLTHSQDCRCKILI